MNLLMTFLSALDGFTLIRPNERKPLVDQHIVAAVFLQLREIPVLLFLRQHTQHLGEHVVLELGDVRANVFHRARCLRPPSPSDLVQLGDFRFGEREPLERERNAIGLDGLARGAINRSRDFDLFGRPRPSPGAVGRHAGCTSDDERGQQKRESAKAAR